MPTPTLPIGATSRTCSSVTRTRPISLGVSASKATVTTVTRRRTYGPSLRNTMVHATPSTLRTLRTTGWVTFTKFIMLALLASTRFGGTQTVSNIPLTVTRLISGDSNRS